MPFEFATAGRILFGPGRSRELPAGGRALVVTGRTPGRYSHLTSRLDAVPFEVSREPTLDVARAATRAALASGCVRVIAIGGGSVIDTGKAAAALAANPGDPLEYLEVIGKGLPLEAPPLDFIAVPTTAGTGSEATRNAVLGSPEHRVKASLRSASMLPRLAIVDPELTLGLPPAVTAATGMDALTQLIEPYLSCRSNPFTDALCRDGIARAARALPLVRSTPGDVGPRTEMSLASLYGGIALANAGLGAVHGFAAPIGGMFDAPHGAVCAVLLPHALRVNLEALSRRGRDIARFTEVARLVTGSAKASAGDGIDWIADLGRELAIPPLRSYGLTAGDIPALSDGAARAGSMKANPVELTPEELAAILEPAL